MNEGKVKILILVEGEKTDVVLMSKLLELYGINKEHEIVSYNTNIYVLYNEMFRDRDPYSMDLLQVLSGREKDDNEKKKFDRRYSDILLIFDFDPQDPQFTPQKITEMVDFFRESSDMGKLYLNYPMVEAFYHMRSIPDQEYDTYTTTLDELKSHAYKTRVMRENRDHDWRKFATTWGECNQVIRQNIEKSWKILGQISNNQKGEIIPESLDILEKQLEMMDEESKLSVLCTCGFYIGDYNPNLLCSNPSIH